MSRAAVASIVFGVYALTAGVVLALAPNTLLDLLGITTTPEPWLRMAGGMAIALGVYYIEAGRAELVPFFRATLVGRVAFFAVAAGCAVSYDLPQLWLFALVDLGGAAWTALALSMDARRPAPAR